MEPAFVLGGVIMRWDPRTRVFDYEADIEGHPPRHEEERLATWVRAQAGGHPYGVLVGPSARRNRTSGFSLAEMAQERNRVRIACYGLTDREALLLPIFSTLTGVPMKTFATRGEAEAWLLEGLAPVLEALSPSTSPTATR